MNLGVIKFIEEITKNFTAWAFEGFNAFIQVTIPTCHAAALTYALRKFALGSALFTQGALFNNAFFFIQISNAIRAAHNTELAANALFFVNLNGAIFFFVAGACWANLYALRVNTVLALHVQKVCLNIWVLSGAIFFRGGANTQSFIPEVTNGHTIDYLA
jgi:hypothetical protein